MIFQRQAFQSRLSSGQTLELVGATDISSMDAKIMGLEPLDQKVLAAGEFGELRIYTNATWTDFNFYEKDQQLYFSVEVEDGPKGI